MPRRGQKWLCSGAGWSVCFLMSGCLGPARVESDPVLVRVEPTAGAGVGKAAAPPPATYEPPPEPQSNYHLQPVTRLQSSLDPYIEPVELQIKPKEEPDKNKKPLPLPAEVVSSPPKKDAPLVAALRLALEKHPGEARALLKQYNKTDRDLLQALLSLTAEVGEGELDRLPPREVERTLEQLHELTLHLRPRAPLTLGKVCFCREIENFGQYTPLPANYEFQAGCDKRPGEFVQVYAEVRNFGSFLHNGRYETCLLSSLSIHNFGGRMGERSSEVVKLNLDPDIDRSLTPRQDYFLKFQFHVFPKLPPGLYTLWITVKDVTPGQPGGGRAVTRSLDFKVCPPGTGS